MKKEKKIKVKKEKSSRFPRFYILDAAIIILILVAFLGIYFRYNVFDLFGNSKNQAEAQITFSIKNIKETSRIFINIGDEVYFKDDDTPLGTFLPSDENSNEALGSITPAITTFFDDGKVISVADPSGSRIDAKGRISCKGSFSDDGSFMLNGSDYLSAGQTITVCTEKITLEITVLSIEKIS